MLDIDIKDDRRNGFDALADLGYSILPDTPMAHIGSAGLHLYFSPGSHDIRNTNGERGRVSGPGSIGADEAASLSCPLRAQATTGIRTGILTPWRSRRSPLLYCRASLKRVPTPNRSSRRMDSPPTPKQRSNVPAALSSALQPGGRKQR